MCRYFWRSLYINTSYLGSRTRSKREIDRTKQLENNNDRRRTNTTTMKTADASITVPASSPPQRHHPVYAQCICQVNPISGLRQRGSCFAVHKGQVSIDFGGASPLNFHPSKCMCNFDTWSKTLWPCFPCKWKASSYTFYLLHSMKNRHYRFEK